MKDVAHDKKLWAEIMQKLKNKGRGLRGKKVKNLHQPSKEKFKALKCVVFREIFRTQVNINDGAFL